MNQSGTVVGYFSSRSKAESAISALRDAGFTRTNIGLAVRSGLDESGDGVSERHEGMWERIKEFFGAEPKGGSGEKYLNGEAELEEGSYAQDDLHSSLSDMQVNEEQSRYFRHHFGSGSEGAVVTVTAAGREDVARQILEESGGDVGASAASYDYGTSQGQQNYAERRDIDAASGEENIRLYGEVLRVHTDRVSRGEARVRKEVHTSTQTVEVPVTREELVVERVPVAGEQAASGATFDEKEIRIPLSEEQARVEKQPVVREEVRVGKKSVSDTETFSEQVRSEDLKVDENVSSPEKKRRTA